MRHGTPARCARLEEEEEEEEEERKPCVNGEHFTSALTIGRLLPHLTSQKVWLIYSNFVYRILYFLFFVLGIHPIFKLSFFRYWIFSSDKYFPPLIKIFSHELKTTPKW